MVKQLKAKRKGKIVKNLRNLVETSAEMFGDKPLYVYKEDKKGPDKIFTYSDNLNHMNYLGTAFCKIGLMGKRVAVIGDTHPTYMTVYYAAVNGGGVIVPLDKEIKDSEIVNFMNLSEVSAVAYTGAFNNRLINYADELPNVEFFIPLQPESETENPKIRRYNDLIKLGKSELSAGNKTFVSYDIDLSKLSAILFTSGTTGTSKGVMLTHNNLTASVNASDQSMEYDEDTTFVDVLPMHHSYEVTCCHLGISNLGGTMYINDSLKNALRNFNYFKPKAIVVVPLFVETIYKRIWNEIDKKGKTQQVKLLMKLSDGLLKHGIDLRDIFFKQITDSIGGNLQSIVCGGAPISPKIVIDFYSWGIFILEGYGITECSPLVAVNRPGKWRSHSVGQPVWGCKVKIDKKSNDETGEILVKGENVMLGYYKNEEATKAVFTDDGWFKTGDIGYMDADDYIYITGRKKNVIILSNGKNIFPEEIEEYLSHEALISENVIIGRKKANGEIVITAVIYPNYEMLDGKTKEEVYSLVRAAVNEINKQLPTFKQVHDIEIRDTEFEKTTSKKIKRYVVK